MYNYCTEFQDLEGKKKYYRSEKKNSEDTIHQLKVSQVLFLFSQITEWSKSFSTHLYGTVAKLHDLIMHLNLSVSASFDFIGFYLFKWQPISFENLTKINW